VSVIFYAWELTFSSYLERKAEGTLAFCHRQSIGKQTIDALAVLLKPGFSMFVAFKQHVSTP